MKSVTSSVCLLQQPADVLFVQHSLSELGLYCKVVGASVRMTWHRCDLLIGRSVFWRAVQYALQTTSVLRMPRESGGSLETGDIGSTLHCTQHLHTLQCNTKMQTCISNLML